MTTAEEQREAAFDTERESGVVCMRDPIALARAYLEHGKKSKSRRALAAVGIEKLCGIAPAGVSREHVKARRALAAAIGVSVHVITRARVVDSQALPELLRAIEDERTHIDAAYDAIRAGEAAQIALATTGTPVRVRVKPVRTYSKTESLIELRRREALPYDYPDVERPRTWGDCVEQELGTRRRPCGFVSCAHHLYLDSGHTGSVQINFPDRDPDELRQTCALRVAESGGASLQRIAKLMNVTRERVRQIEERALSKVQDRFVRLEAGESMRSIAKTRYVVHSDRGLTSSALAFVREHPGTTYAEVVASLAEAKSHRARKMYTTIGSLIRMGRIRKDERKRLWIG